MTKIKICGLTTPEDIACVNESGADYAGFVLFFPKSKRNLSIENARLLLEKLAPEITSVAVTVSPTLEQVKQIEEAGFQILQVHGTLTDEIVYTCGIPIFRALNIPDCAPLTSAPEAIHYFSHTDTGAQSVELPPSITGVVLDGAIPGSGKGFDWQLSKDFIARLDKRLIIVLAGGLNAENVREAIETLHPEVVDVSSGVEHISGTHKDSEKIQKFINTVKEIRKE